MKNLDKLLTASKFKNWLACKFTTINEIKKLVDIKKWSHLKVSYIYMLLQLLINIILFYSYKLPTQSQWYLAFLFCLVFILLYVFVFRLLKKHNRIMKI